MAILKLTIQNPALQIFGIASRNHKLMFYGLLT
uniref:Uncharacterized protein n=1 Tax=Arundo donax TaxID=35708 RepID=A0A0A8Z5B8_ARUDO